MTQRMSSGQKMNSINDDGSEDYDDLYDDDNSSSEASNNKFSNLYSNSTPHSSDNNTGACNYSSSLSNDSILPGSVLANSNSTFFTFSRNIESKKRDHHNRLERKRRASIKDCFNDLRSVLPGIMGRKPSRAVILQKAAKELHDIELDNVQTLRSIRWYVSQAEELNMRTNNMQRTLEALQARLEFGYDDEDIENDDEQENCHLEGFSSSGHSDAYDYS